MVNKQKYWSNFFSDFLTHTFSWTLSKDFPPTDVTYALWKVKWSFRFHSIDIYSLFSSPLFCFKIFREVLPGTNAGSPHFYLIHPKKTNEYSESQYKVRDGSLTDIFMSLGLCWQTLYVRVNWLKSNLQKVDFLIMH